MLPVKTFKVQITMTMPGSESHANAPSASRAKKTDTGTWWVPGLALRARRRQPLTGQPEIESGLLTAWRGAPGRVTRKQRGCAAYVRVESSIGISRRRNNKVLYMITQSFSYT
jgi:hypothetical protein